MLLFSVAAAGLLGAPARAAKSDPLNLEIQILSPSVFVYQFTPPASPKPSRESLTRLLQDKTLPEMSVGYLPGKVTIRTYAVDLPELRRQEKFIEKRLKSAFGKVTQTKHCLTPVSLAQTEKIRTILAAQLEELQKSLGFKYRLETRPAAAFSLKITEIKSLAARENLLRNIVPPRGKIEIRLLSDRYSLVSRPVTNQLPEILFLDKKANMRQTPSGKVLSESRLIFSAADLRPLPKIKIFTAPGKPNRWMTTFTLVPEAGPRLNKFSRGHIGRNIAFVIDKKIIAAQKITHRLTGGQLVLSLSPPFGENSPEGIRLRQELNKRPMPLPVVVKEVKEKT